MSLAPRPLIVRLRNWIGDVVLGLPALEHLQEHGYQPILVGKAWARDLLSGTPWEVQALAKGYRGRVAQLRRLARTCRDLDPAFDTRVNTVVLPFSFSSALDARLAGLKAIGYRYEGRGFLLHRALDLPQGGHEIGRYWQLAIETTGALESPLPESLRLPISEAARFQAKGRLQGARIGRDYVVLCPFAGGPIAGKDRHWPGFPEFARRLHRKGLELVMCPGPNEVESARCDFPDACVLEGVGLAAYAAIIQGARFMVSNDTGPGHMAAAVGSPLVSVLGPTLPEQWRAWGPGVSVVRAPEGWPTIDEVMAAVEPHLP